MLGYDELLVSGQKHPDRSAIVIQTCATADGEELEGQWRNSCQHDCDQRQRISRSTSHYKSWPPFRLHFSITPRLLPSYPNVNMQYNTPLVNETLFAPEYPAASLLTPTTFAPRANASALNGAVPSEQVSGPQDARMLESTFRMLCEELAVPSQVSRAHCQRRCAIGGFLTKSLPRSGCLR